VTSLLSAVSRFTATIPLKASPVPVTFPDPEITMAPMPVALSCAKMPLPARPITGDEVTIPIEPAPFWITEIPVTAPVTAPVETIPMFDGLA
jgi:hypothetical protein